MNSTKNMKEIVACDTNQQRSSTTKDHDLEAIKSELSDMPFEEIQKLKEKLGLKVFNQLISKRNSSQSKKKIFLRDNKNRPREMSSKKPVRKGGNKFASKEKISRDPRFDDISGEFNEQRFKQSYSFIGDIKKREKLTLKKKLSKTKDKEKKQDIEYLIQRQNQEEKSDQAKKARANNEYIQKQKEKQMVKEGKTPFYLKKSEKRKLELAEKFRELKKSGSIDKYLIRKRKKNARKERKKHS